MSRAKLRNPLIVLAVCGLLALGSVSMLQSAGGLSLRACFDDAGGLERGDPVMVGGVVVGKVVSIELDRDYRACAALDIDGRIELADDTSAAIHTRSVLGDRYVALEPGGSNDRLRDGDEVSFTQSALVLERLIGRLLMQLGDD